MTAINCYINFADKPYQLVVQADRIDVSQGIDIMIAFLDDKIVAIVPMSKIESAFLRE